MFNPASCSKLTSSSLLNFDPWSQTEAVLMKESRNHRLGFIVQGSSNVCCQYTVIHSTHVGVGGGVGGCASPSKKKQNFKPAVALGGDKSKVSHRQNLSSVDNEWTFKAFLPGAAEAFRETDQCRCCCWCKSIKASRAHPL